MAYLRNIMESTCNVFCRATLAVLAFLSASVFPSSVSGQILDPVSWEVGLYPSASGEAGQVDLVFQAEVEPCWHIYSQFLDNMDGPLPTYFEIGLPEGADSLGHVRECEPIVAYDPNFMMDLKYFEESVSWVLTLYLS